MTSNLLRFSRTSTGLALVAVISGGMIVPAGVARHTPPTVKVDPRFGHQSVVVDGITILTPNALEPTRNTLEKLLRREGPWSSCDTGAEARGQQDGRWFVAWSARGMEAWTHDDPLIPRCATTRSAGVVSKITLRLPGSVINTPYGRFAVGAGLSTLPGILRSHLKAVGSLEYYMPLESGCTPGTPVQAVESHRDTKILDIILTIGDPRQRIAVVSIDTLRSVGCRPPPMPPRSSAQLSPLGIGPLRFGMTSTEAMKALGRAVSVLAGANGCSFWTIAGFPSGTQLIAFNGKLGYVLSFQRGLQTTRGVRVGDGVSQLRRAYSGKLRPGVSGSLSVAEERLFTDQLSSGTEFTLEFDINQGLVSFIRAGPRKTIETLSECA